MQDEQDRAVHCAGAEAPAVDPASLGHESEQEAAVLHVGLVHLGDQVGRVGRREA